VATVQSRQMVVPTSATVSISDNFEVPEAAPGCLVPVLEFMNHRPSAVMAGPVPGGDHGQLVTKTVNVGEELFTNYGALSIELSFHSYGFSSAEMAPNLATVLRDMMEMLLSGESPFGYGPVHSENIGKQMVEKKCQTMDNVANAGVLKWALLKKLLQCTRIMFSSPRAMEHMIRRETDDEDISMRPFDFNAEMKSLEHWTNFFNRTMQGDEEWLASDLGKKPASERTPKETWAAAVRLAERKFLKWHMKELKRLYDRADLLNDKLEKDMKNWKLRVEDKKQFRLTSNMTAIEEEERTENQRVDAALEGSFTEHGEESGLTGDEQISGGGGGILGAFNRAQSNDYDMDEF